jgi:hypothetical protein
MSRHCCGPSVLVMVVKSLASGRKYPSPSFLAARAV